MENPTNLFSAFKPVPKSEWLAKIEKDLKGKPLDDLVQDIGGVSVSAFQHAEDLEALPLPLHSTNNWEIGEDFEVAGDLKAVNAKLLEALQNGVGAPRFILEKKLQPAEIATLLDGVDLGIISTHFYFKNRETSPTALFADFIKMAGEKQVDLSGLKLSLNFNDDSAVPAILENLKNVGSGIKVLTVNGIDFLSESDTVTELAKMITQGERFLSSFSSEKSAPSSLNGHLQFSVAIGKNYFLQIAKLRALKLLWANILRAYGIDESAMPPIEAHLAPFSQGNDPNKNMIAATTQAMSAIIGGADRLTVLPSDAFEGNPSGFSRRIARNVQHILKLESHFDWVADPGAGSYFIEKLTVGLAERAWEMFQEN